MASPVRSVSQYLMRNKEIMPLAGIITFAVSFAVYHTVRGIRANDVVWRHHKDPFPWQHSAPEKGFHPERP